MTIIPVLTLMGGLGCGGFRASRSVSPASFLLPGLIQTAPVSAPESDNLLQPGTTRQLALSR